MNEGLGGYELETDPDVDQEILDEVRRRFEASMQIADAVVALAPGLTTGTLEFSDNESRRISDLFKAGWTESSGRQALIQGISLLGGPSDAQS